MRPYQVLLSLFLLMELVAIVVFNLTPNDVFPNIALNEPSLTALRWYTGALTVIVLTVLWAILTLDDDKLRVLVAITTVYHAFISLDIGIFSCATVSKV